MQPYEFGISESFSLTTRLFIVRSTVVFTNLNIVAYHDNVDKVHIRAVNLQNLSLTFSDNYIETTGKFFYTMDNLQLYFVRNTANLTNSLVLL